MTAILGPSGSGKSTLLYILGCLLQPTSGHYHLAGLDVAKQTDAELAEVRSREIGFVFQQFHLLPRATVLENLLLGSRYLNPPRDEKELQARAHELLVHFGIDQVAHHKPNELSGGQQQRVAIARALMNNPDLILADEPTGNLDSQSAGQVLDLLQSIHASGKTVVIITHDLEVAKRCTRVVTVKDGNLTDLDGPGALPTHQKIKSFAFSLATGKTAHFRSDLRNAWQNISRSKSRSFLTMVGVTIGVAAVLSTLTLGSYTREKILKSYESLGVNKLVVRAYPRWNLSATEVKGDQVRRRQHETRRGPNETNVL